jgi:hypothetical protein
VAAIGTGLALVTYTTPVATLASTAAGPAPGRRPGVDSQLMSLGLAVALLPAGAVGDDHGRRRMLASARSCSRRRAHAVCCGAGVAGWPGSRRCGDRGLGLIGHVGAEGRALWGASVGAGIAAGPLLAAAGWAGERTG